MNFQKIVLTASVLIAASIGMATAQEYPSRDINVIVPFPAGTTPDIIARIVMEDLSKRLEQPVVVVNRPGAGAVLGAREVANSAPDGYTLLATPASPLSVRQATAKEPPFDTLRDFVPVAQTGSTSNVLFVNSDFPASTIEEVVAEFKKNPGKYSYGFSGIGGVSNILTENLKRKAGYEAIGVPYQGSGAIMTDVLGGRLTMGADAIPSALPFIVDGRVKALAVGGGSRSSALPNVPTLKESGIPGLEDFELTIWTGVFAPAGTPAEIVTLLNEEINNVVSSPEVIQKMEQRYIDSPPVMTPKEFYDFMEADVERWKEITTELGFFRTLAD